MSSRPELRLDWCGHDAAKYAVEHWHYSKSLPRFKVVRVGVWEDGVFIGCVLFSNGAAPQSHCPYRIKRTEVCELTRIALNKHSAPVSRIVSIAMKFLRRNSPGLRLIISYADPEQKHHGGIYAAGGWVYCGKTKIDIQFEMADTGKRIHSKTIKSGRPGYATELKKRGLIKGVKTWKHKYLMPLDDEMRKQILPLKKPYPKRAGSDTLDTPSDQLGEGGSLPTPALHSS